MRKIAAGIFIISLTLSVHAQMGINNSSPDASSVIDMTSTSAGVLVPRMTEAQRDAISSPATGLQVYQTNNEEGVYFYDGSKWRTVASNDRTITTITATTTLDDGHDIVFVNNSSVIDVDLPTAVGQDGRTYYIKKISNNTTRARIDPNGSQTIDGADSLELFVRYDAVRIVSDGSNWLVISDELKPHMAKMNRNAAQTISTATVTKVAFDNEEFDNAGIADIATNDRFDIRRAGKYVVSGFWEYQCANDTEYQGLYIYKNGSSVVKRFEWASSSNFSGNQTSTVLDLAVDDYIEMYIDHNNGSDCSTENTTDAKARMSVTEIR